MKKKYFILMADVIRSRSYTGNKVINELTKIADHFNKIQKSKFLSPITITLGDEFQAIITNYEEAIKLIVSIEEEFINRKINFRLRYILHYGYIDTPINKKIAYSMYGEGLTYAREYLESNKNTEGKRVFILCRNKLKDDIMEKAFEIIINFIDNWKIKDYKLIYNLIFQGEKTNLEIANKLKQEPSTVSRRKKTLNILEYNNIKSILYYLAQKNGN